MHVKRSSYDITPHNAVRGSPCYVLARDTQAPRREPQSRLASLLVEKCFIKYSDASRSSSFLLQRALLDSAAQHLTRLTGRYAFSLQWDQLMSIAISRCGYELLTVP